MGDVGEYWRETKGSRRTAKSELGEIFADMKEGKKQQRLDRGEYHRELIKESGLPHLSRNSGHHYIFHIGKLTFDFWPASGKWRDHRGLAIDYGWEKLLARMKDSERNE